MFVLRSGKYSRNSVPKIWKIPETWKGRSVKKTLNLLGWVNIACHHQWFQSQQVPIPFILAILNG